MSVPAIPRQKPPASTGTRPTRSISRPEGNAASAAAERKIAGPSPRIDSTPVTSTRVRVETATASCTIPELHVRQVASRNVLRRTGYAAGPAAVTPSAPSESTPRTACAAWSAGS